jgi:hypothetical protein
MTGMWGDSRPARKLDGGQGESWLKSPEGYAVVRITSAGESLHAKWCAVTNADAGDDGKLRVGLPRRMLRFNAVQLWQNLIRRGWRRVPPQW